MYNKNIDSWILKELGLLGIPLPKLKKIRLQIHKKSQRGKDVGVFGVSLSKLLPDINSSNSEVNVPCFLEKLTCFLMNHLNHLCIFRKNGNTDRMKHLKQSLEGGDDLTENTFVEDAAGVLKAWFRDLPVPLIPQEFHDLFFSCYRVCEASCSSKALLLACSLLPVEHLSTLKYILEFLAQVSHQSAQNKMNSHSLAIVFAPNFMPSVCHKLDRSIGIEALKEKQAKERAVVQWLIERWEEVKNTPASVEFLANLSFERSKKKENSNRKETKRRKSMCDIVSVKIKKMVVPHSNLNQTDGEKSMKNVSKRKAEVGAVTVSPDSPPKRVRTALTEPVKTDEASTSVDFSQDSKQLNACEINATTTPKCRSSERIKKKARASCSPCCSGSGSSPESPDFQANVCKEENAPPSIVIHLHDSPVKTNIPSNQTVPATIEVDLHQTDNPESTHTPTRNENEILRPKSTLRRGRPNTLNSGLKSAKRTQLRSNSLENLAPNLEVTDISKRRSRSASSIFDKTNEDNSGSINVSSDVINRVLNFTTEGSLENLNSFGSLGGSIAQGKLNVGASSSVSNSMLKIFEEKSPIGSSFNSLDNLLGTSLGFSPMLNISTGSDLKENFHSATSINSDQLRNPFDDITNDSQLPTLGSTMGVDSLFTESPSQCEDEIKHTSPMKSSFSNSKEENFITPSPILKKNEQKKIKAKLSITASSTPANDSMKICWKGADTFNFNENLGEDIEGTKRESIIKLREMNAGKVLASISLYDNKFKSPKGIVPKSPAWLKRNAFERNALATKSVRERSQKFTDTQGFKVPSGCPSSIRRLPKKSVLQRSNTQVQATKLQPNKSRDPTGACKPLPENQSGNCNSKQKELKLDAILKNHQQNANVGDSKAIWFHSKMLF